MKTIFDSDNEAPSDVDSSEEGESADESGEESNECEDTEERDYSNLMWSSVIRPPQDRNFNEEVGMRVEMENNSSCLNYFELLFTDKKNEKKETAKNVILIQIQDVISTIWLFQNWRHGLVSP